MRRTGRTTTSWVLVACGRPAALTALAVAAALVVAPRRIRPGASITRDRLADWIDTLAACGSAAGTSCGSFDPSDAFPRPGGGPPRPLGPVAGRG